MSATGRLRVVGPGRAGRSFALALERRGWEMAGFVARGDDPTAAAADVELCLIATPDAVVAPVAGRIRPVDACVVAHVAGSLGLDVLAGHERRASIHPLVSLPDPEIGSVRLLGPDGRGAWFAVAGDTLARDVVAQLGGRGISVPDEHRAGYHAAACIASNHLVALLGQVERVAAGAGVPLEAYLDLVRDTVENVAALGPANALTGPVRRGDDATLDRHRAVLARAELPGYEAMIDLARMLL